MAAVRLIAIAGFVVVITLLEQTKPMEARRVKVVHIGTRVRKLDKKVDELKRKSPPGSSVNVRKKHFTSNIYTVFLDYAIK